MICQTREIAISSIVQVNNHSRMSDAKANQGIPELMRSINQHGVQQAIGVTKHTRGKYRVVFGNRRLEACRKLGHKKIPATVLEVDEKTGAILNLVENVHRSDLDAFSRGRAYLEMRKKYKLSVAEIAARCNVKEKVVQADINVFKAVPVALQADLTISDNRGRRSKAPGISETLLKNLVQNAQKYKVGSKKLTEILKEIPKADIVHSGQATSVLASVGRGTSVKQAIKEANEVDVVRPTFQIRKSTVKRLEKKYNKDIATVIKMIVAGKVKEKLLAK